MSAKEREHLIVKTVVVFALIAAIVVGVVLYVQDQQAQNSRAIDQTSTLSPYPTQQYPQLKTP